MGRAGLNLYFAQRFPNKMVSNSLPERVRPDFPILSREVHGKPLVYLDNAASAQKPLAVIEGQKEYLSNYHANIHRGAHHLAALATEAYEGARRKIADHIGATAVEEVLFTAGSTDAVNLVAQSWGRANLQEGDTVLVTRMEHHANIVPWQMVCEEKGAEVVPVNVLADGTLDLDDFHAALSHQPKLVTSTEHPGYHQPDSGPVCACQRGGRPDAGRRPQALPHLSIDVQAIGCDFYVATGHKAYGPTGIGFLWGRKEVLENMPPWRGGGMIQSVSFDGTTYNGLPASSRPAIPPHLRRHCPRHRPRLDERHWHRHHRRPRACTGGACPQRTGHPHWRPHHRHRARQGRCGVFVVDGLHPYDLGTLLDGQGIAVRTGHHCTEPLMSHFGLDAGTLRMSFAAYTTREEIDRAVIALERAMRMLS